MQNKCTGCMHWVGNYIVQKYKEYGPGFCIFDNCCTKIPYHITHNGDGQCQLFNKDPKELWPDIVVIKEK